MKLHL